MQPLKNCIGPTIRIGREILCLPYAGFFKDHVGVLTPVDVQYFMVSSLSSVIYQSLLLSGQLIFSV